MAPHENYDDWHGMNPDNIIMVNGQVWSHEDARDFMRHYDAAAGAGIEQYEWRGNTVLLGYAKYLAEYLREKGITIS